MSDIKTRARQTAAEIEARRGSMPANFNAPQRYRHPLKPATGTSVHGAPGRVRRFLNNLLRRTV